MFCQQRHFEPIALSPPLSRMVIPTIGKNEDMITFIKSDGQFHASVAWVVKVPKVLAESCRGAGAIEWRKGMDTLVYIGQPNDETAAELE
jgi:hypothetical protein